MTISKTDLTRLRAETPACEKILHFNNAGASLMPDPVFNAVTQHLALEREVGGYEAEAQTKPMLDRFYSAFAELLRVDANEIAYVENATRGWDMAFYALPLKEGDRIITHASEYASNYLAFLQLAKRRGVDIDIAPSDHSGQIDVGAIEELITPKTRVIAITHVPTQGGLVNPVIEVGRIAKFHNLIYLLDACQSVGQLDVDVSKIGCDILSGTGRKFLRGPRGTGFLYVSGDLTEQLDPPFIDLHSATWTGPCSFELAPGARRFENWESYIAGRVGLAKAVDYALDIGLKQIEERVRLLAHQLREKLRDQSGVKVHDQGLQKCGIVTFTKSDEAPDDLAKRLSNAGANVSVSPKEYALLDFGSRNLSSLVRASIHYFNTEDEIDRFCELIAVRK